MRYPPSPAFARLRRRLRRARPTSAFAKRFGGQVQHTPMSIPIIHTDTYNYDLPQARIAQHPLSERDASKLLVYRQQQIETDIYRNLPSYLPAQGLMVFNNSKVIPARLLYVKETSGVIELFCLEPVQGTPYEALHHQGSTTWICMIGGLKKWKTHHPLTWTLTNEMGTVEARFAGSATDGFRVEFSWSQTGLTFADILDHLGQMPIPPYLLRKAEAEDQTRYQTVYATVEGSVAAPTAGLHFTPELLERISAQGIESAYLTLHVGAGTFKPVQAERAHEHAMHAEWVEVNLELIGKLRTTATCISVGTTSLRSLESLYWYAVHATKTNELPSPEFVLPQFMPYETQGELSRAAAFELLYTLMQASGLRKLVFRTELMIMPGYRMRVATQLLTNFHQPKSTLLMLVDAFTSGRWRAIYTHALDNEFRFLSYGDGCLLTWENET